MWKVLNKGENQHYSSTTYIWDALKESEKSVMKLWQTTEIFSNPGFLLEPRKKLPTRASWKPDAETVSSWSCDMEGHAKKIA